MIDHKIVKGFRDLKGFEAWKKRYLLSLLQEIAKNYNVTFLDLPLVEEERVFQKALGKYSDICQKEFFYLQNKNLKKKIMWVLRPEFSGSIVRSLKTSKFFSQQKNDNFFTFGPCFRYENPQKNRYRQFVQWNFEQIYHQFSDFGFVLNLLKAILKTFDIEREVIIETNYLSSNQLEKISEKIALLNVENFCSLCQTRLQVKNVFRIFDCKKCSSFVENINLQNFLSVQEKQIYQTYFQKMKIIFENTKIISVPKLTRGLDYYRGFVFEIKTKSLSKKDTLIAGGMYRLSFFDSSFPEQKFGFGFALGIERIISFLKNSFFDSLKKSLQPSILIAFNDQKFLDNAYRLQSVLCDQKLNVIVYNKAINFPKVLQKTLQKEAKWLLFLGREYQQNNKIVVRKIDRSSKINKEYQQFLIEYDKISFFFQNEH